MQNESGFPHGFYGAAQWRRIRSKAAGIKAVKVSSIADVLTGGAHGVSRVITDGVQPSKYYPNHQAVEFYSRYKEDIVLFAVMGFKCFRTFVA